MGYYFSVKVFLTFANKEAAEKALKQGILDIDLDTYREFRLLSSRTFKNTKKQEHLQQFEPHIVDNVIVAYGLCYAIYEEEKNRTTMILDGVIAELYKRFPLLHSMEAWGSFEDHGCSGRHLITKCNGEIKREDIKSSLYKHGGKIDLDTTWHTSFTELADDCQDDSYDQPWKQRKPIIRKMMEEAAVLAKKYRDYTIVRNGKGQVIEVSAGILHVQRILPYFGTDEDECTSDDDDEKDNDDVNMS